MLLHQGPGTFRITFLDEDAADVGVELFILLYNSGRRKQNVFLIMKFAFK